MKIIKLLVFVFSMFLVGQVKAQEVNPKTKKKMKWIDANKDGVIDNEELKTFYKDKKNKKGEPIKYQLMFLGLDANEDGKISLLELDKPVNWKSAKLKMKTKKI